MAYENSKADHIRAICSQLPKGESALVCAGCGHVIPEPRRQKLPGVKLCVPCKELEERGTVS